MTSITTGIMFVPLFDRFPVITHNLLHFIFHTDDVSLNNKYSYQIVYLSLETSIYLKL